MKKCLQCETVYDDTAMGFCPNCGSLESEPIAPAKTLDVEMPELDAEPVSGDLAANADASSESQTGSSAASSSKPAASASSDDWKSGCIGFLSIIAGLYFLRWLLGDVLGIF